MKRKICVLLVVILVLLNISNVFAVGVNTANILINPVEIEVASGYVFFTTYVSSQKSGKKVTHVDFVVDDGDLEVTRNVNAEEKTEVYKAVGEKEFTAGTHTVYARAYWSDGQYNTTPEYTFTTGTRCWHQAQTRSLVKTTYQQIKGDENNHYENSLYNITCSECGEILDTTTKEVERSHSFNGNTCKHCGYTKQACKHSDYDDVYQTTKYEKLNDTKHYKIDVYKRVCEDCGVTIKSSVEDKTQQSHSFSGNSCKHCGYTKQACKHSNYDDVYQTTKYEKLNDTKHHKIDVYKRVCEDCGVTIKSSVEDETQQSHSFSGNSCKQCGYTKPNDIPEHKDNDIPVIPSIKKLAAPVLASPDLDGDTYYAECGDKVKIKWDEVEGADYYSVIMWKDPTAKVRLKYIEERTTSRSTTLDAVDEEGLFAYSVYACVNGDDSLQSEPCSFNVYYDNSKAEAERKAHEEEAARQAAEQAAINAVNQAAVQKKNNNKFSDVDSTKPYASAVNNLSDMGIINGYGNGTFNPEGTLTRAEAATIICRLSGYSSLSNTATSFSDVKSSHWASGFVNKAYQLGYISGYGDGKFGPENKLTYYQFIKICVCYAGYASDAENKGGWPEGYRKVAAERGMLNGVPSVNYNSNITRADASIIAYAAKNF